VAGGEVLKSLGLGDAGAVGCETEDEMFEALGLGDEGTGCCVAAFGPGDGGDDG
jgi:hypothetical protein